MKSFFLLIAFFTFFSCTKETIDNQYTLIGEKVALDAAVEITDLANEMASTNTMENMVVSGTVSDVCKAKGCWMKLDLANGESMRVTFKDYALFMPKDITGKNVVIHGVASKKEVSLDDLKHYAKDAGKSEAEIAEIVQPETQLTFEADGVVIK